MSTTTFSARVEKAAVLPDEAAVREFWSQFKGELENDSSLKARFQANPAVVLGERGLSVDIQQAVLVAVGVLDEEACGMTCISTCPFTALELE